MATKAALISEINTNFADNTTGNITPAIQRTTHTDEVNSWQQAPATNAQVGTTYTIATTDYGQLVTFANASPVAVSLPAASTGGFNPFSVMVRNLGAGVVTITPTAGSIDGASSLVLTQNASAWLVGDGTNYHTFTASPFFVKNTAPYTFNTASPIQTNINSAFSGVMTVNSNSAVTSTMVCFNDLLAYCQFGVAGSTFTPLGALGAGNAFLYTQVAKLVLMADAVSSVISLACGGTSPQEKMRIDGVTSFTRGAFGYGIAGNGDGGTVTQSTSKTTGVTLNTTTGKITCNNSAIGANWQGGAPATFTLTNSQIAANDFLMLSYSGGTAGAYNLNAVCANGSATITITNVSNFGTLGEAIVITFVLIKAVTT